MFSSAQDFLKVIKEKGTNCVDGKKIHLPKLIRVSLRGHKTNEKFIEICSKNSNSYLLKA
jgi:hypothetical protein